MSDLLNGNVEITLDGDAYTLTPSLRAGMLICDFFGGFLDADQRLKKFDLRALSFVIGAGLGKSAPKDLDDKVWKTGVAALTGPVIGALLTAGTPSVCAELWEARSRRDASTMPTITLATTTSKR